MSDNNRIFYACQGVAISNHGDTNITSANMIHGLQSIGTTTNFNLEQAFELGQIEIYENIEGTPDIEITLEKVIDGYPFIYHLASTGVTGSNASGLVARSKERCDLRLGIYSEALDHISTAADNSGKSEVEVYCSGTYISSVSINIPVDGNATESVTLAGNNKQWLTGSNVKITDSAVNSFDGTDQPLALGIDSSPSGGIQRREDFIMSDCVLPVSIKGVNGSGVGNGYNFSTGLNRVHLQSVSVSTDFSREDILELGRKTPYYRPAGFPIEVTCDIEAITTSGDFVTAFEYGDPALYTTIASGNNTGEEKIFFKLRAGIGIDLGPSNRLSSVTYGGGDADGGNVTTTYSFTNFNDFDLQHHSHNNVGFQANA